jgi:NADP-dependent 3-hydroxy acid dehydrogenase YdfG
MSKVAIIVGVGPGLGAAVARRFAREGYAVGLAARRKEALAPFETELAGVGVKVASAACDATDAFSVKSALASLRERLGACDALVYNAGAFEMGSILDITPEQLDRCWKANCAGALYAAQQVLPDMLAEKSGTILLTGATASMRGSARFACLAVGKFGLRALAQSMARELGPQGVHVAHVVIDGQIDSERARSAARPIEQVLSPEAIAETYWQLHRQPASAWTLEMDLRPNVEKF